MDGLGGPVVVFVPRMAEAAWWARPLHYQHCYLAQRQGRLTQILHHEGLFLRVETAEEDIWRHLARMCAEKQAVAWVTQRRLRAARAMIRPPMTCVEVVKAALGIAAPWIFTPRQLERHLSRHGATRLMPT